MEVSDQDWKAREQEFAAASISSWVALGTRPTTSLVAWGARQSESGMMTESLRGGGGGGLLLHLGVININEKMIVFFLPPFIFQVWYVIKEDGSAFLCMSLILNLGPAKGFDFKSFAVSRMEWKIKKKTFVAVKNEVCQY